MERKNGAKKGSDKVADNKKEKNGALALKEPLKSIL